MSSLSRCCAGENRVLSRFDYYHNRRCPANRPTPIALTTTLNISRKPSMLSSCIIIIPLSRSSSLFAKVVLANIPSSSRFACMHQYNVPARRQETVVGTYYPPVPAPLHSKKVCVLGQSSSQNSKIIRATRTSFLFKGWRNFPHPENQLPIRAIFARLLS